MAREKLVVHKELPGAFRVHEGRGGWAWKVLDFGSRDLKPLLNLARRRRAVFLDEPPNLLAHSQPFPGVLIRRFFEGLRLEPAADPIGFEGGIRTEFVDLGQRVFGEHGLPHFSFGIS